ncbi:MAG: serine/threonine-protein kinase [Pyrinomonadaceae bacterium]
MNNAANWIQVKEIFSSALEVEPEWRDGFVAKLCGNDDALRAEVESWLASHAESEGFIDTPVFSANEIFSHITPFEGRHFGKYTIIREIGHGGMGAVYLAERSDGEFEQKVALKIVRQSIAEEQIIDRFKRERQILASLNHRNIAKLLDGGVSDKGEPYIVMEFVEGTTISDFAEHNQLNLRARLELFIKVCAAVEFAHRSLVVHRDIKPGNILVTKDGEPKLLDFGLARLMENDGSMDAAQTRTAFRALTPAYASPEQLRGEPITTASDTYSLGVVLYELLSGKRPFELKTTSFVEIIRHISTDEPVRPSDAANQAVSPSPHPRVSASLLKGDLDNIVLMALRKEPERRYKSVGDFVEDVGRHMQNLPVSARPSTFRYRSEKFIKRNKIAALAASVIVLAILSGLIVSLWQADVARRQRDLANAEKLKAEHINQFLSEALAYSNPAAAVAGTNNRRDATISQMLDDFAPRIETELADQPEIRAELQRTVGMAYHSQLRFSDAERYLNAALETQLNLYGDDDKEIAYTLTCLATLQSSKGDFAASKQSLQKAIAIYHNQPPIDQLHIRVFSAALATSGDLSWTQGDYKAAESDYLEALALASQLHGNARETVADAKIGLGMTRFAQGRLDEAVTLLRDAVSTYRDMPHTRWKLPQALNSLGQVLTWKNQFDEALTILRESAAISLEVWGENKYVYPRSLWLQVYALCFKGECSAAEKLLDKAEELCNSNFPDNKPINANNYDARNLFLTHTGHPREGEKFGKLSIELYQSTMNRGATSITLARLHLAESLIAQKKYEEAEAVLLEAYKDASEVQGLQHWHTKDVAKQLASLYEILGKKELAGQYTPYQ